MNKAIEVKFGNLLYLIYLLIFLKNKFGHLCTNQKQMFPSASQPLQLRLQ